MAVGAFCFALFSVLSKRVRLEPVSLILVYFLVASLASLLGMALFSRFAWPSPQTLVPVVLNGVLVNGLSYVLWLRALRLAEASFLAPLVFLTPLLSTAYLVAWFDEPFLPAYAVALVLMLLAGLLNSRSAGTGTDKTATAEGAVDVR